MEKAELLAMLYLAKNQSVNFKNMEDCINQFELTKKQFKEELAKYHSRDWEIK